MADNDNVRVAYEDGLILGADELTDDQRYVRARFERRSLSRDTPGIAYGLALSQEPTSSRIVVSPGVAYGGDGKVLVVRHEQSLSYLTQWERIHPLFPGSIEGLVAVYLRYSESRQDGASDFCGQSQDPRIVEGFEFFLERVPSNSHLQRLPPHENLAFDPSSGAFPVQIGALRVRLDVQTQVATATVVLAEEALPCGGAKKPKYPTGAQYAGVIGSGLVHPRRWNDDGIGQGHTPPLEVRPDLGVRVNEPLSLKSDLYFEKGDEALHVKFGDAEAAKPGAGSKTSFATLEICKEGASHPLISASSEELVVLPKMLKATNADLQDVSAKKLESENLQVSLQTELKGTVKLEDSLTVEKDAKFGASATSHGALIVERAAEDQAADRPTLRVDVNAGTFCVVNGTAEFKKPVTMLEGVTFENDVVHNGAVQISQPLRSLDVGRLQVDEVIRADGGLATFFQAGSVPPVPNHAVVPDGAGKVRLANDGNDAAKVVGVAVTAVANGCLVVSSGVARAQVTGSVSNGDWLRLSNNGTLEKVDEAHFDDYVGKMVAKALETGSGLVNVLVTLG